ncbi:MAG: fumarylacetoacetate hydrolase family protein [Myxococcales bacterium]|nr:fumarylacetoacetate hydrolase family protein [Myxococcales bacterium]
MKIARLSLRSSSRPRVALERDGAYYDVEALELDADLRSRAAPALVDVPGDRWDFHSRVVALSGAGLAELDSLLLKGERPTAARVVDRFAVLPPFDSERATFLEVDTRGGRLSSRVGLARAVAGPDDLVSVARGERQPMLEVGLAVLVGEDLSDATRPEAKHAIAGVTIFIDWFFADAEAGSLGARGRSAQVGPWLVPSASLVRFGDAAVSLARSGGETSLGAVRDLGVSLEDALAFASREAPIRAGDLVGIAPFPRSVGLVASWHEPIAVSVERIGTLRGTPVPRR